MERATLRSEDAIGEDSRIWRYTGLTKFVAMLTGGGLHFTKASTLQDPYEGFSTFVAQPDVLSDYQA